MWSNLNRMDFKGGRPEDNIANEIAENLPLLLQEIKICRPDIIIFLTGPCYNYDDLIGYNFDKYKSQIVSNEFKERELVRLELPHTNAKAYRTYHPGAYRANHPSTLCRPERQDKIIKTIVADFKK